MSVVLDRPLVHEADGVDDGPIILHIYDYPWTRALCGHVCDWPVGKPWRHLPSQMCVVCDDLDGSL